MTGFEPAAPTSRTWCATKLRYIPKIYSIINFYFVSLLSGWYGLRTWHKLNASACVLRTPLPSNRSLDLRPLLGSRGGTVFVLCAKLTVSACVLRTPLPSSSLIKLTLNSLDSGAHPHRFALGSLLHPEICS